MIWSVGDIGKKITCTPEITVVKKGKPTEGVLMAIGHGYLRVQMADGTEQQIETRLCEK